MPTGRYVRVPDKTAKFIPTPDQIKDRSAEVRKNWTEKELQHRAGIIVTYWVPPLIPGVEETGEPADA